MYKEALRELEKNKAELEAHVSSISDKLAIEQQERASEAEEHRKNVDELHREKAECQKRERELVGQVQQLSV